MSTQPVFLVGAAFVQLSDDIGLTTTTLGIAAAAFFLAAGVASTPLGRVVERIGWRRALRWNAVVAGLVLIGIAAFVKSATALTAFLVVGGVAYGLTNPAANKALAERVDPARRALIFGLKHGGIPVSTLIAGLAVPLLIVNIGWRPTYAIAALLVPVVWLLISRHPQPVTEIAGASAPGRGAHPMTGRRLTVLAFAGSLATGAAVSLSTFLVAASVDNSFTESQAGLLLFAGSAASVTARIIAGAATDARRGRGFVGVALLMGCGAVVFFVLPAAEGAVFAALVVLAFATGWGWPGLLTFTVVNANAGTAAASSGITQSGIFLGSGLSPLAMGWMIDRWSYGASWVLVGCLLLVAAAVVAGVGRAARRPTAQVVADDGSR
jgi:MFS family permease